MRSRLDLRDRVTLATALVLAGGVAILSAGALLLLHGQLSRDIRSTLDERADAQIAAVARVGGRTVVRGAPDDVLDEQTWVFDATGRALRRPRVSPAVERTARSLAGVTRATDRTVDDEVRLRAEPVRDGGERIGTVVVGVALDPYERTEHLTLLALVFLDLCIVAIGALLARRAVGKALQPVADMTAQAADWSEHDLDRRFDLGPPRDELTALSATLDALLGRIAASLRREQRLSAELAHELRTPLTGVRGEAELALGDPQAPAETRAALERIVAGTDRLQGVIDTLLAAARGEGERGDSDPVVAVAEALAAAAPAARAAGVELAASPPPAPSPPDGGPPPRDAARLPRDAASSPRAGVRVAAEQRLVEQALAPLLANAIRHARGRVEVSVAAVGGGGVAIAVADDGAGFPAGDLERLFAPGVSEAGGAGLGLPLALRLARAAGGEVTAEP
ncbi:histidine kinase dimerization/phospho-acceptor domain-containing protein, partial [Conexibacter sp. JD483]|uniref:ATP-binding protein n=2 Tax=Conexibacter TaxID=191494 RepID=UPI00287021F4